MGMSHDENPNNSNESTESKHPGAEQEFTPGPNQDQEQSGSEPNAEFLNLDEAELRALAQEQRVAIDALESEKLGLIDRALRLQADFDNFRRRTREESVRSADGVREKLVAELLPILDNLERAVQSSDAEADNALVSGVKMVLKQFQTVLERYEVSAIEAVGAEFDPNLHDAIMQVDPSEEYPSGTVVEELQKGYVFKGKTLRPSMVKVAQ